MKSFETRGASLVLALSVVLAPMLMGAESCETNSKMVEITILHTNDMHSHFHPESSTSEKNPYNLGGMPRLKTLVDQLRGKLANTMLLDAGDWSESTPYFFVDAGSNMLGIMDAMGYDAAVVGNHDFLNGPSELAATIERAGAAFPVLGANKDLSALTTPDRDRVAKALPDYVILERGGIKIGVIGLLCNDFFYYDYFKPAVVTNAVARATAIANKLHNEKLADVIVLLSHNDFNLNVAWARQVPWVNVVISGHSHKKVTQAVETTNAGRPAYIVEAKSWAQYLGQLTLLVNKEENRVILKEYKLHPVLPELAEDPKIASLVAEADQKLAQKYGRADLRHDHVADCTDEMVHDDEREVPLGNLLADAYREAIGTQIGLESVQLTNDGLTPGPLSSWDLMDTASHIYGPVAGRPFPEKGRAWTLKILKIRGLALRGLLNLSFVLEGAKLMGHIAVSGARVTHLESGMSAIQSIHILNSATDRYEPIVDDRDYTVTLHDGLLLAIRILSAKLGINLDLSRIEDSGIETWQAVTMHAMLKKTLRAGDYEAGTRYRSVHTDLGFYEHDVAVVSRSDGSRSVKVTVKNEGLENAPAGAFSLQILRGLPNDVQGDSMPGNERIPISDDSIVLPALAAGARATIEVPWTNLPAPGIYALRVQINESDANPKNNAVIVHARIDMP